MDSAQRRLGHAWLVAIALTMAMALPTAHAADRPFLSTTTAVAEEDDDNVWSVEAWLVAGRAGSRQVLAAEYAFNPTTSIQLETGRVRLGPGEHATVTELELRHLFNHIARDGWGWGVTLAAERSSAGQHGVSIGMPLSLKLDAVDGFVHVNAGVAKEAGERRIGFGAIGYEQAMGRGLRAFAELARADNTTTAHAGIRHWIKRDRIAFDVGVLKIRGESGAALVLGFGFYDLGP